MKVLAGDILIHTDTLAECYVKKVINGFATVVDTSAGRSRVLPPELLEHYVKAY